MKIGTYKDVPCIQHAIQTRGIQLVCRPRPAWIPVLGDRHPDPELGNPRPHYHIDYRFMTDAYIRWLFGTSVIHNKVKVIAAPQLPLTYRRLRCERPFSIMVPALIVIGTINGTEIRSFEESMSDKTVIRRGGCAICPHKGISLDCAERISEDKPDVVECPGHGLAWDMKTGKLYRRAVE